MCTRTPPHNGHFELVTYTAVVTGAAGFIGSHLCEELLGRGDRVLGIDSFNHFYDPAVKQANLKGALSDRNFTLVSVDLREAELQELMSGADVVFHLAGQPGVRTSFGDDFWEYCGNNILATQRVLDAALAARVSRVVYASSSSVYGNALRHPSSEEDLPRPFSPYGVTKLAAEHLCSVYAENWNLSTVALRYFTVYGPRQRPDMAMHRIINAALNGEPLPLFGDGQQVRDFTYVSDVVEANLAAAEAELPPNAIINVSGGSTVTMADVIAMVEELSGRPVKLDRQGAQPGDVRETGGSSEKARKLLEWIPKVSLLEGLRGQLDHALADRAQGTSF